MFGLTNLKKLFSYNWSLVFKSFFSDSNGDKISALEYDDIESGALLRIISNVLIEIAVVGCAIFSIIINSSDLYGDKVVEYAIKSRLISNIGSIFTDVVIASIIPVVILIYNVIMKDKKQKSVGFFIMFLIALFESIFYIFKIPTWITNFNINVLFAALGIIGVLMSLIANTYIFVGSIDFCLRVFKKNDIKDSVVNIVIDNANKVEVEEELTNIDDVLKTSNSIEPVSIVNEVDYSNVDSCESNINDIFNNFENIINVDSNNNSNVNTESDLDKIIVVPYIDESLKNEYFMSDEKDNVVNNLEVSNMDNDENNNVTEFVIEPIDEEYYRNYFMEIDVDSQNVDKTNNAPQLVIEPIVDDNDEEDIQPIIIPDDAELIELKEFDTDEVDNINNNKFCENCGTLLEENANFCIECGYSVK